MPRRNVKNEKAKDFKGAMKRLIKELKPFKVLIMVGLILAAFGSVLSIVAPNRLSDLVDEISKGLVIDKDNMMLVTNTITNNMENINASDILANSDLSDEEKNKFLLFLDSYGKSDFYEKFFDLSNNTLELIFPPFDVDGKPISTSDQVEYLKLFSDIGSDQIDVTVLYSKIDKMPDTIVAIIEPKFNMSRIKFIIIFLIVLYLVSAIFTYVESISMTSVSNNFAKRLRSNISEKINKLPLKYFDKNSTGDVLSRVTNDIDTIAQSMNQSFSNLVSAVTLFLGTILMMFLTNWIMAITAIVSSLIGFIFMALVLSKSQKYFNDRQKYLGKINGHIEEVYSGINVVKVYNGKKHVNSKFDDLNEEVYQANRKGQFLSGIMMPMMSFVGNFGYVAVCVVGALLTMNGYITFGVIVAFITYVRLFTSPLSQIGQAMTSLQTTAAAGERVFEFLDEEEMSDQKEILKYLDKESVSGDISFEHVKFTYDGNERPTINDFDVSVKSGQKVAIVGPTGSGKTTMVNLLMKFYEFDSGDIKIDGISIKDLSRKNIHDLFTMVLQDTWIFDGTVKENIIYNRDYVSDDDIKSICKTVGLDHFIKTLPDGYNTILSDHDSVSAGQRQLLTIARGMVEDAPFLILDEATSNVDTRTEELVQKAMDKLIEGRTSFIIAHRLSTIKNADLIIVMNNGDIVEQGTHETLMKKNGFYAELYNSQFEL